MSVSIDKAKGWGDREQPKMDFTAEEIDALLAFARATVESVVLEEPCEADLPHELVDAPAYGVFVTLRRAVGMRACRGRFAGEDRGTRLAELISLAATDAAEADARFPRIAAGELDRLAIDLSVLHSPETLDAAGDALVQAVEVGKHGLVLSHPQGRGLLLPHVATENGWDALTFLKHLSRKAGLHEDAWRDDGAAIETFQSRLFTQPAPQAEFNPATLTQDQFRSLLCASAPLREPILSAPRPEALGLYLLTDSGLSASAIASNKSLAELADMAHASLRQTTDEPATRMAILYQPIRLTATDYPQRTATLAAGAVLAQRDGAWSLAVPQTNQPADRVGEALSAIGVGAADWAQAESEGRSMPRLTAFNMFGYRSNPAGSASGAVRPAARAGAFYPGSAAAIKQALDGHFATPGIDAGDVAPQPHAAVMLPHAGWRYCGDTAARTIARCKVPRNVIILGPNHTGRGAPLAVAPQERWELPGLSVPIATDIAADLVAIGFTLDAEAHVMEHGSEVLLPFLHRMNRDVRVCPVVIGRCDCDEAIRLGQSLADVAARHDALLVISSDMNHFAPEAEGRRLDRLALDAMQSGPRKLYETCQRHQISMCGMVPAVMVMAALLQRGGELRGKLRGELRGELVHYTTSAEASGDPSSVVGYAGMLLD